MGQVDINDILDKNVIDEIREYYVNNPESSVSEVKNALNNNYSYGEIRMVLATMK